MTTATLSLSCMLALAPYAQASPIASAGTATAATAASAAAMDPALKARVAALLSKLPADYSARVNAALDRFGVESHGLDLATGAVDEECGPTAFATWVGAQVRLLNPESLDAVGQLGAFSLAIIDAIANKTEATPQSFGTSGEYTTTITNTTRDLDNFWDIDSSGIQTVAMKGDIVTDADRMAALMERFFGLDAATAREAAETIKAVVQSDPAMRNGDHPLFTLNAIAFTAEGADDDPVVGGLPDKLIMGDGVMAAMAGIGYGDVGPRAILAHEFGHHVQYDKKLIDQSQPPSPEGTRRIELMADAFSSHFLTHKRGQAINAKRAADALQSYAVVGDCQTDQPGHHGTPAQRAASAAWAAEEASSAQKQGHVLPSLEFAERFDANLDEIIAG